MAKSVKLIVGCLLVMLASVVPPAAASVKHPTGDFAGFNYCPTEVATVELCVAASETGQFQLGKLTLPITHPLTLQFGLHENRSGALEAVLPGGGKGFVMPPAEVPGGVAAFGPGFARGLCNTLTTTSMCTVTGSAELVGLPKVNSTALIFEEGIALEVPLRLVIHNALLGEHCDIGSSEVPVLLRLTTGTTSPPLPNKPVKGSSGQLSFSDEGNLLTFTGNVLMDNAFKVPAVEGCGGAFGFLVETQFDSSVGLPAPAGHNSVRLEGDMQEALASAVRESE